MACNALSVNLVKLVRCRAGPLVRAPACPRPWGFLGSGPGCANAVCWWWRAKRDWRAAGPTHGVALRPAQGLPVPPPSPEGRGGGAGAHPDAALCARYAAQLRKGGAVARGGAVPGRNDLYGPKGPGPLRPPHAPSARAGTHSCGCMCARASGCASTRARASGALGGPGGHTCVPPCPVDLPR